jgi:hypothetical protein
MKKLILLICLPLLLFACSVFSTALTDKDVEQYVQAYRNIAAISPALEVLRKENKSLLVLTCTPCRVPLEKAIQEAGYKDLTQFLIADARMHLALRAYATVQITKLAGTVGEQLTPEEFCKLKDEIAKTNDPKEVKLECERVLASASYLNKAGKVIVGLAEKLLHQADIAMIGKHIDAISSALFNEKLVDDFRHVRGGGHDMD